MFQSIHQKLGTAGFIISIVALVAALGGGAYAASGGLNGKQKKEVEKIAKKYAGKPGKNGAAGATGPAGTAGAKGDAGGAGASGGPGSPGAIGKSVTVGTATVGECSAGGATVQVEGEASTKKHVCNGVSGFTETLPAGKTETGTYGGAAPAAAVTPISFNIPLAIAPTGAHYIDLVGEEHTGQEPAHAPTHCLGTVEEPTAPPGEVCLYGVVEQSAGWTGFAGFPEVHKSGVVALFSASEPSASAFVTGTWAVTAATS